MRKRIAKWLRSLANKVDPSVGGIDFTVHCDASRFIQGMNVAGKALAEFGRQAARSAQLVGAGQNAAADASKD